MSDFNVFSKINYIKFYNRYVDDIFLLIPKDKLNQTLKYLIVLIKIYNSHMN